MDHVDLENSLELLKSQKEKCKSLCIGFISFTVHFLLVMGLLVAGSFIFIELEEKDSDTETNPSQFNTSNSYLERMIQNITDDFQKTQNVTNFLNAIKRNSFCSSKIVSSQKTLSKYEKFLKWFHFGNVVGTTIGYGNVVPVTNEGRLFFIGYAIFIIPAMLTLLARCGEIMTTVNKFIFKLMRTYCFKKSSFMSDALLSAVSLGLQFIGYIHLLYLWPDLRDSSWNYIEYIYFWFVTFTTIGFGDLSYEINDYEYVLTVYRLFGLALLAGLIDSIVVFARERREKLKKLREKVKQQTLMAKEKMKDMADKQVSDIKRDKTTSQSSKEKNKDDTKAEPKKKSKKDTNKNSVDNPAFETNKDKDFHLHYGIYRPAEEIW